MGCVLYGWWVIRRRKKNQTAVAHVIRHSKGWAVHASEYPWRDSDNNDNFLDLVATNGKFILTVECKKTKEILTFLRPLGGPTTGHVDDFVLEHYIFSNSEPRRGSS